MPNPQLPHRSTGTNFPLARAVALAAGFTLGLCSAADAAQESWRAFEVPSLCLESPAPAPIVRLDRGYHVQFETDSVESLERRSPVSLPLSDLLSLLAGEAARAKAPLRFLPGSAPLLARGGPEALATAEATLADLAAFGKALEIEVHAWWLPGVSAQPVRPDDATARQLVAAAKPLGSARVRSGASVDLGQRRERSFVASFWVEVASDSNAPDPWIGRVLSGRTLHLDLARVRGGRAVHVDALLDLAEEQAQVEFDPDTLDLGIVQQPVVEALQLGFSGSVDSGGWLALSVEGRAPFDGVLLLQLATTADPATPARWRAFDLALANATPQQRPAPLPWDDDSNSGDELTPREKLDAAAFAQVADEAARSGESRLSSLKGRDSRSGPQWSEGLLLVPAGDSEALAELGTVISALERTRTTGREFDVQHGNVRVRGPLAEGGALRVLSVTETTALVDQDVEVAEKSWTPSPRIERMLAGFSVEGQLESGGLAVRGWSSQRAPNTRVERHAAGLAALELFDRGLRSGSARVETGSTRDLLEATASHPALRVALSPAK